MPQHSKRYIVDIDETICESHGDYPNARPYPDRIQKINDLYDQGHTIIYWTARGANSGKDWGDLTKGQLDEWGCKRHELWMNKPAYDIWVDDKAQWLF
jgi:hypothetical protein